MPDHFEVWKIAGVEYELLHFTTASEPETTFIGTREACIEEAPITPRQVDD